MVPRLQTYLSQYRFEVTAAGRDNSRLRQFGRVQGQVHNQPLMPNATSAEYRAWMTF